MVSAQKARRSISLPLTLCIDAPAQGEGEALWAATVLTLRRYRDIRRVMAASAEVEIQLREAAGALGYSLRVDILRRRFWTVTIWTDEASVARFLATPAHKAAEPLADELGSPTAFRASARWHDAATAAVDWRRVEHHVIAAACEEDHEARRCSRSRS